MNMLQVAVMICSNAYYTRKSDQCSVLPEH
jgi:hypothetical protein